MGRRNSPKDNIMARLHGTNVQNTTVFGHQHEDGYWMVDGNNGHTVVEMNAASIIASVTRSSTGVWVATLSEVQPCNLKFFHVDPVLLSTSATPLMFVLFQNNVGVAGATSNTITFGFVNPTTNALTDLAAGTGMCYQLGLQLSTAYYTKQY
jgi:hypothetical protein